ncbi:hypothetical protein AAG570_012846 [Ranatra chinensis]|uniref:Ig-like domain-containing protein n=1 Tax=Ranatra chinensis TaxID=642074 RepID=A0ABD0YF61_9HEMI
MFTDPPQVSVRLGANLNGSSIREGVDVYFECTIDANPRITRVIWNRAGRSIINDPSGGVIVSNQTLVLQSVSRSSAGYYSCGAANSQGETHSSPFLLHVKCKHFVDEPECGDRQQKVYGAARLEEVLVECEVDANPAPSEFRWWFNNSSVRRRPLETFNWTKGYSVAAYTPTSETDYGTLLCSATNQLGTQAVPCVFHIVPAGKPDTPQNCTVTNRSMSWIQVNCVRGFDGGLPQEIAAEISHNGRIILNLTSGAGALFHISGLDPGNEYFVTIYSTNAKGKSDPTNLIVTTLGQSQQPHRRITGM